MKRSLPIGLTVLLLCAAFLYPGCTCDDDDDDNDVGDDDDNNDDDDDTLDDDDSSIIDDDDDIDDDDTTDDDSSPIGEDDSTDDDTGDDDDDDTPFAWPEQPPEPSNDIGVFVAQIGDDANPGTMSAPKRTVQAGATLAAATGKVVFVAEGLYTENVTTVVSLFGGYESSSWTYDPENHQTIIDAAAKTFAVRLPQETTAIVEGFTLVGNAVYNNVYNIYENNAIIVETGRVLLRRDIIRTTDYDNPLNYTTVYNQSVLIRGGKTRVERCTVISGIVGSYGGGVLTPVYVDQGAQAEIVDNYLEAKQGIGLGCLAAGTIVQTGAQALLINNHLKTNEAAVSGGLVSFGRTLALHNLIQPTVGDYTFGAWLCGGRHLLGNNIVHGGEGYEVLPVRVTTTGNAAIQLFGNDFYNQSGEALLIADGILLSDVDEVDACQWAGCDQAQGNIAAEPMLYGDFAHLTAGSPCIDAGIDPSPWYDGPEIDFDFEGDARPQGDGWDIGMDEYGAPRQP